MQREVFGKSAFVHSTKRFMRHGTVPCLVESGILCFEAEIHIQSTNIVQT